MPSSVQALIKSTQTSPASGARSRPAVEGDGEAFQAELGRAAKRARKPEAAEEPKPAKASRSRKADAKGKPREAQAEETPVESAEATSAKPDESPADEPVVAEDSAPVEATDTAAIATVIEKPERKESPLLAVAVAITAPAVQDEPVAVVEQAETAVAPSTTAVNPATATPVETEATEATTPPAKQGVPVPTDTAQAEPTAEPEAPLVPQAKAELPKPKTEQPAAAEPLQQAPAKPEEAPAPEKAAPIKEGPTLEVPQQLTPKAAVHVGSPDKPQGPQAPPEARFAQDNHENIVRSVRTELLPRGGTMQIRLDPPELGALNVILSIKDGVATASFQTSNEQATQMLSHSLSQLKTAMESTGITVDKLQVTQAPRSQDSNPKEDNQQRGQPGGDEMARQQEQQRKEMLRKLWRRLNVGSDPLDLVA